MAKQPTTPPAELVRQWGHDANLSRAPYSDEQWAYEQHIATRAAQWGADQELEACCEWLEDWVGNDSYAVPMRAARRPKPPSLKEQAMQALNRFMASDGHDDWSEEEIADDFTLLRLAVEQLND